MSRYQFQLMTRENPIGIVELEFRNNNFADIELNPYEGFWYEF